jgi:hypothetical protein
MNWKTLLVIASLSLTTGLTACNKEAEAPKTDATAPAATEAPKTDAGAPAADTKPADAPKGDAMKPADAPKTDAKPADAPKGDAMKKPADGAKTDAKPAADAPKKP